MASDSKGLLRNEAKQFMKSCAPPEMAQFDMSLVQQCIDQTLTHLIIVIRSIISGDALEED